MQNARRAKLTSVSDYNNRGTWNFENNSSFLEFCSISTQDEIIAILDDHDWITEFESALKLTDTTTHQKTVLSRTFYTWTITIYELLILQLH